MTGTSAPPRPGITQWVHHILFKFDSLRLIAPPDDPQYRAWFDERSRSLVSYNQLAGLLGPSITLCGLLCLLRIAFVRWAHKIAQQAHRRRIVSNGANRGDGASAPGGAAAPDTAPAGPDLRWSEGCWTMTGCSALLLWSWVCVAASNGGCPRWPALDTSRCLEGWPLLPIAPIVRSYYCCELAWYLHLLAKHHLGVGLHDSGLMVAHHVTSIYLIVMSYCFSFHRPGVLMLALLNSSTPLLHLSKTAHHTGSRRLALVSFAAFAAIFLVSRVVVFPLVLLPIGLLQPLRYIPRVLQHYPLTLAVVNGLMGVLVVMQWVWFAAVVRILRQAAAGDATRLAAGAQTLEHRGEVVTDVYDNAGGGGGGGDDGLDTPLLAGGGSAQGTGGGAAASLAIASAPAGLTELMAARVYPVEPVSGGGGGGGGEVVALGPVFRITAGCGAAPPPLRTNAASRCWDEDGDFKAGEFKAGEEDGGGGGVPTGLAPARVVRESWAATGGSRAAAAAGGGGSSSSSPTASACTAAPRAR